MPPPRRIIIASFIASLLVGCSRTPEEATGPATNNKRVALQWTQRLSHENLAILTALPSALFGPYVAGYLTHRSALPYRGSLEAVNAQMDILYEAASQEEREDAALTVLEHLGSALEVNLTDLLNRSPEREKALNAYINALRTLLAMGTKQQGALEEQRGTIGDERRERRRTSSDIQHELHQALREKNYSIAGSRQEELTRAEADLAASQAQETHIQSLIDIYKDLLEVGGERLYAIEKNRSALIAGVEVIQVPGTEDIGVLQRGDRRPRAGYESLFDPGPLGGQ